MIKRILIHGESIHHRYYIDVSHSPFVWIEIDNWWDVDVMPSSLIADSPRRNFWKHQGDILGSIA